LVQRLLSKSAHPLDRETLCNLRYRLQWLPVDSTSCESRQIYVRSCCRALSELNDVEELLAETFDNVSTATLAEFTIAFDRLDKSHRTREVFEKLLLRSDSDREYDALQRAASNLIRRSILRNFPEMSTFVLDRLKEKQVMPEVRYFAEALHHLSPSVRILHLTDIFERLLRLSAT
jgi:hypothetical protein